jgi:ribosomal protein S18 acetylase RimI-like enzyme
MTELHTRPMRCADASQCVGVHLQSFKGFFLSFLGESFLRELYTSILNDPSGIGFVIETEGKMIGFVIGSAAPSGLYTRLLRRRLFHFGLASLGAFIKKPAILPRLLRAFSMPSQRDPRPACGSLMSIAVLPQVQGCGAGQCLVHTFLEEACRRGLQRISLTTDSINNESANSFYTRLGFTLYRDFTTPEGRQMNEYLIALPSSQHSLTPAYPEARPVPSMAA